MLLSIIQLDKFNNEGIEYVNTSEGNFSFPLIRIDGDEVNVYVLPEQFDVFDFSTDLLTVSGLFTFAQETLLQNVLNIYEVIEDSNYWDLILDVSKIDFEFDNEELILEVQHRGEGGATAQLNLTNSARKPELNVPILADGKQGHSEVYNSTLNLINNFISIISNGNADIREGWIDRIEKVMTTPMDAKRHLLEEGVDDKIELIQEYTAPDFLALKTLTINLGTETKGIPVGDPVYLYLDEEINTDTHNFRYIDKLGEKTPIQYQNMRTEIVSKQAQTAVPGSYVQLAINYTTDSGTIDYGPTYESAVPCTFDGSNILWFGGGGSGQELTMIKIEKALYNTQSFWIDVDEDRIIIYPKGDFEEYRINSAILTNVM